MAAPSLKKLVTKSVAKGISIKDFISLYYQLNERNAIEENEYLTELLEINPLITSVKESQGAYAIGLSLDSKEEVSRFWKHFQMLNIEQQSLYLVQLCKFLKYNHFNVTKEVLNELINKELLRYSVEVLNYVPNEADYAPKNSLVNNVIFLWGLIFYMFSDYLDPDCIKSLLKTTGNIAGSQRLDYIVSKSMKLLKQNHINVDSLNSFTLASAENKFTGMTIFDQEGIYKVNEVRNLLWLNWAIKNWKFHDNGSFIKSFIYLVGDDQRFVNFPFELIRLSFKSAAIAQVSKERQYVIFNIRNFITSRLPWIVSELNSEDTKAMESSILLAFSTTTTAITEEVNQFRSERHSPVDLRKLFVKSCIANELIPIQARHMFFSEETMTQQALIHELNQCKAKFDVKYEVEQKILSINTEFTSLAESGLNEFFNSLPKTLEFSKQNQESFGAAILEIVDTLITDKETEKLSRLLLSLIGNKTVVMLLAFNNVNGPFTLLQKLVNYVDRGEFGEEEDDSFEDLFSHFGTSLLAITSLVEIFNIDISSYNIKGSYSIDYLNSYYFRSFSNLTDLVPKNLSDDDSTIVNNYESLLRDWIEALFDEANEGLSDDIIKSVEVKQIFKLVPIIYQQAIVAAEKGLIDFKILNNGLDYLGQYFLASATLSIIKWLLSVTPMSDDPKNVPLKVLMELIRTNTGGNQNEVSNDSHMVFKIIIQLIGKDILMFLSELGGSKPSESVQDAKSRVQKCLGFSTEEHDLETSVTVAESIAEKFKSHVLKIVNSDQLDFSVIFSLPTIDCIQILHTVIDQISFPLKSNNENQKMIVLLASTIFILKSVVSSRDKEYWEMSFSSSPSKSFPGPVSVDIEFKLSLGYHYSSIFNDQSLPQEEDDDLFNEIPSSVSPRSVEELFSHCIRFKGALYHLLKLSNCLRLNKSEVNEATKAFKEITLEQLRVLPI